MGCQKYGENSANFNLLPERCDLMLHFWLSPGSQKLQAPEFAA
jgi:hypothetical protein